MELQHALSHSSQTLIWPFTGQGNILWAYEKFQETNRSKLVNKNVFLP